MQPTVAGINRSVTTSGKKISATMADAVCASDVLIIDMRIAVLKDLWQTLPRGGDETEPVKFKNNGVAVMPSGVDLDMQVNGWLGSHHEQAEAYLTAGEGSVTAEGGDERRPSRRRAR
jgi:hypothetical protein